mgnify:CR=1 FL=1
MAARCALLLLDGLDEAGKKRAEIEEQERSRWATVVACFIVEAELPVAATFDSSDEARHVVARALGASAVALAAELPLDRAKIALAGGMRNAALVTTFRWPLSAALLLAFETVVR